jgi:hypothetical protein
MYDTNNIDCEGAVLNTTGAYLNLVIALLIMVTYASVAVIVELGAK